MKRNASGGLFEQSLPEPDVAGVSVQEDRVAHDRRAQVERVAAVHELERAGAFSDSSLHMNGRHTLAVLRL